MYTIRVDTFMDGCILITERMKVWKEGTFCSSCLMVQSSDLDVCAIVF